FSSTRIRQRTASRHLGQRYRNRIDLRSKEIIDTVSGGSFCELIRLVLVGPRSIFTGVVRHVENGIYANKAMRIDRRTTVAWITWQEVRIDAAAGIELSVVDINLFVEADLRANHLGAKICASRDAIRRRPFGRRKGTVIANVIECAGRARRSSGHKCR